jgi:hypothetical protein
MNIEERIDHYEQMINELRAHPAVYSKAEVLTLEILLDILRELKKLEYYAKQPRS